MAFVFVFILSTCGIITRYHTDSTENQAESGGGGRSDGEPCLSEYLQDEENGLASVVPGATWPASAVVAGRVLKRGLWGAENSLTDPTWSLETGAKR